MTGKVLIVGDQGTDAKAIHRLLKEKTHFVSRLAEKAAFGLELVYEFKPDIVVLNPEGGIEEMLGIYDTLKKERSTTEIPVLLMIRESDLAAGDIPIPLGIADLLAKPVRPSECMARIFFAFRKFNRLSEKTLIRAGKLEIDVSRYEVRAGGRQVDLTYTEYELLKFLASNPGQVFDRDVLLNKVWGYDYFGGARTVDVHVRRLRSKIESRTLQFIETIRNVGYKFIPQDDDDL
ncbi:MAG: response regulator transcription factor [Candidatus Omnitrophica bacterium]|nr:response regulator transcription factor [Candidatus Omnitrophota bacterium]